MPRWLLFIPLLVFAALSFFLWKGLSIDPRELPSALLDKPFPEFSLPSLQQPDKMLSNADFKGKTVLVNVWATWCPSCRQEHEQLLAIAAENSIPVIGLNYKDERASAQNWLQKLGNPYQFNIYDEQGMLGLDLGVYGAPETYVVDAQGIIRHRHVGVLTAEVWRQLKTMIAQGWDDAAN